MIFIEYNTAVESPTNHMARRRSAYKKKRGLEKFASRRHPRRRVMWREVEAEILSGAWGMLLYTHRNVKVTDWHHDLCSIAVNASYFCRQHNRSSVYRCAAAARNAIL